MKFKQIEAKISDISYLQPLPKLGIFNQVENARKRIMKEVEIRMCNIASNTPFNT